MSVTTDTLFGDAGQSGAAVQPSHSQAALTPDQALETLVGEGRKYKDIKELAKAYIEADSFIEKLKSENATYSEKLKEAATLETVLKRIQQQPGTGTDQPGQSAAPQAQTPAGQLTADGVAEIVKKTVTGLETERTKMANRLRAEAAMKELYGDKAKDVFVREAPTEQARAALQQLAEVDPDKFIALFRPAQRPAGSSFTPSSISSVGVAGASAARAEDPNAKEFYDALRKKDPKAYYSQDVQLRMNRAATSNPAHFFGRKP